jgi:hypothetical protein
MSNLNSPPAHYKTEENETEELMFKSEETELQIFYCKIITDNYSI